LLLIGPTPPKKKKNKSEGVLGFRNKNIEREKIIICQWGGGHKQLEMSFVSRV